MAEAQWIKIATDIFDDEKMLLIASMPDGEALQLCWIKMLCQAGKKNNGGVFSIGNVPYTDEMFSTILRVPLQIVHSALDTFEALSMISRSSGAVTIINWNKHQSLDALERRREADKEYQRKRRMLKAASAELIDDVSILSADASDDESADVSRRVEECRHTEKSREEESREEKSRAEQKHKEGAFASFAGSDEILLGALKDFERMRRSIKKPMTERAKALLLAELQKSPRTDWVEMLGNATLNNWLSVYPLKHKPTPVRQADNTTPIDDINRMRLMAEALKK